MVEPPEVKTRPKGGSKSLFGGGLNLTISLSEQDRNRVEEKLDSMSDKIEKNWRITQVIMAVGIGLAIIGEVFKAIL